jgi:hypothetical protein
LVPLAVAQDAFGASTVFFGELSAADYSFRIDVPGASAALTGAANYRGCSWGVPNSDGSFSQAVATLTPSVRASLESSLLAAGFAQYTVDTVSSFQLEYEDFVSTVGATYVFTGDVVIITEGTGIALTETIGSSAYGALIVANPTLPL